MKKKISEYLECEADKKDSDVKEYEYDSSKFVWSYFEIVYANSLLSERYDITNKCNLRVILDSNKKILKKPCKGGRRITALIKSAERKKMQKNAGEKIIGNLSRLGGECDFNFNEIKVGKFRKIIEKCKEKTEAEKDTIKTRLENYSAKHHSLLNLSLMQVVGNMQKVKQNGGFGEKLDRLDSFVYWLGQYYENDCELILYEASKANRNSLKFFLDSFKKDGASKGEAIYEYCKQIYFIYGEIEINGINLDAKKFVSELTKNGKKYIDTSKDLEYYMSLADKFWAFKEKHYDDTQNK